MKTFLFLIAVTFLFSCSNSKPEPTIDNKLDFKGKTVERIEVEKGVVSSCIIPKKAVVIVFSDSSRLELTVFSSFGSSWQVIENYKK